MTPARRVITDAGEGSCAPGGMVPDLADLWDPDNATSPWVVEFSDWDPLDEGRIEALCTLGNGLFAVRGADAEVSADGIRYPGAYAAGVYDRAESEIEGHSLEHESIVNLPNWLRWSLRVGDGPWLGGPSWETVEHRKALLMRSGLLLRMVRCRDREGRIFTIRERRFVGMADPHLAGSEWSVTSENFSGRLVLRSTLDVAVENANVAAHRELSGHHTRLAGTGRLENVAWVEVETVQSHVRCAQASRTSLRTPDGRPCRWSSSQGRDGLHRDLSVDIEAGETIVAEKVVASFTSHDRAISDPGIAAREMARDAPGFDDLLEAHCLAWEHLWRRCGLDLVDGDAGTARALNLHVFHVLQTLSPHVADADVGVPARGLHGEGYRGHVFWDELFVFPFLNLRIPDLTRSLLLYRHRRLPAARRLARAAGLEGAMFPWQSGSDGREETPDRLYNPRSGRWMPDRSRLQRHVGLAVAYNVWQYYQVTADRDFLESYGAEMLVEISRLFAGLAHHDPNDDRYHIDGVMGPDEFHDGYPERPGQGIDDNAYTNVLASWLLQRTVEACRLLADDHCGELWERLGVTDEEIAAWERISHRLAVPFLDSGIIAQFDGYDRLEELDWAAYRRRHGNIGRLDLILEAEHDTPNRYRASKQADVLMLFYLFSADELTGLFSWLGYRFDPAMILPTIDFYTTRTTNGSTLSRVVNAWVLSRSDRERSWRFFTDALIADMADTQGGTTREGIHLGAMAGTLDLVQRCYLGVEVRDDVLWFDPGLPREVGHLALSLRYRSHWIDVRADDGSLSVSSRPCDSAAIEVGMFGRVVELRPGHRVVAPLDGPAGSPAEGPEAPVNGRRPDRRVTERP